MFAAIGSVGVGVHLLTLAVLFRALTMPFMWAQSGATLVAMTFNFFLNNVITYRDVRLHGVGLVCGLMTFVLTCGLGALANVGIAVYLFEIRTYWLISAMRGSPSARCGITP
jgi:dolichol-phosphate mannosyltransferase